MALPVPVPKLKPAIREGEGGKSLRADGWTLVHWTARHGDLECLRVLVEAKSDLHKADNDGSTPAVS